MTDGSAKDRGASRDESPRTAGSATSSTGRGLQWSVAAVLLVGAIGSAALVLQGIALPCRDDGGCPTVDDLRSGVVLPEAVTLVDRRGDPMVAVGGRRRLHIPLESIPPHVRGAWIAIEDRRFRDHGGVDLRGALRAVAANVRAGAIVQGASTIAMQLVRIVWRGELSGKNPWERKFVELVMAPRLVDELGHDRVLELYLNGIYLGEGTWGVGAAARHYFDRRVERLSPAQAALLAAMTKTPGRYDPTDHPARARSRRDLVLDRMAARGVISREVAEHAKATPLGLSEPGVRYRRSYATAAVRRELETMVPELSGRPGLRIHTTLDPRAQSLADSLLARHLAAIDSGAFGPRSTPGQAVQGALLAVDSRRGGILAVAGGHDFAESEWNRAIQSRRPVGSLVKPLLFAAAVEAGVSPIRPVSADTITVESADGAWAPRDHVDPGRLLPRDVIVRSSNRAAVRLGQATGMGSFVRKLREFGLSGTIPPYASSFLGAFDATLADVTGAMATFDNSGRRVEPHLIRRVEGPTGTILWERPPARVRSVVGPGTAFLVLDALQAAATRGTGWRVGEHVQGRPVAGKTGTSDGGHDNWFVGLTPGLAAGVWIGHDEPAPVVPGGSGGRLAAPLWGRFVGALGPPVDSTAWRPPSNVRPVLVDLETGVVRSAGCGDPGGRTRAAWARTVDAPLRSDCSPIVESLPAGAAETALPSDRIDAPPLPDTARRRSGG